jgi:hypothetical protein
MLCIITPIHFRRSQLPEKMSNTKLGHIVFGQYSFRPPHETCHFDFDASQPNNHMPDMDTRELAIQSAIHDLNSGVYTSQRQASKAYGIPRTTLQARLAGHQPHAIAHQNQQRLTPDQEEFLVEWILDEDLRAQPPSHNRVREMATRILRMNGDNAPLGQIWVSHFLKRNERVHSIIGRSIEAARTDSTNTEAIRAWLELVEQTRVRLGIRAEDTWNIDETSIGLRVCNNSQVIISSSKRKAYVKSPENREWVSIVEVVLASGQKLRPLVIFKGNNLQTT